jgi:hypothetical protein
MATPSHPYPSPRPLKSLEFAHSRKAVSLAKERERERKRERGAVSGDVSSVVWVRDREAQDGESASVSPPHTFSTFVAL